MYISLEEDPLSKDLVEALKKGDPTATKFQLHNNLLCYQPKGTKRRRYITPLPLRPMLLKYFHDSPMFRHLGTFKTWKKVGCQFYWPKLWDDIFQYVRQCDLCQRTKPAQDTKVGLHTATPVPYPLERVFIDFMVPLVHTKRENQANLVVMDSFSTFVAFYLVHNITSAVVCDIGKPVFYSLRGP